MVPAKLSPESAQAGCIARGPSFYDESTGVAPQKVSTIEFDNELDGETVHILPFLPKEHTYSFIIGSDQLPTFHLWLDFQNYYTQCHFRFFRDMGTPTNHCMKG